MFQTKAHCDAPPRVFEEGACLLGGDEVRKAHLACEFSGS